LAPPPPSVLLAFSNDLVNELVNWFNETDTTYRAELRELNELNFADSWWPYGAREGS